MSTTIFKSPGGPTLNVPVLVVQPDVPQLLSALAVLTSLNLDAVVAESFKDAKVSVTTARPALLIADIKLREFNGLHLLLRARAVWPTIPALITSSTNDTVLRLETERLDATFVELPTSSREFSAAVCRTMLVARTLMPIRSPFERRCAERRRAEVSTLPNRRVTERRRTLTEALAAIHV